MAFNIESFKAEHGKRNSVLRSNRFEIMINGFTPVGADSTLQRSLSFWCEGAQFPGYQLLSHNMRRYVYGTNEARPFSPNFNPIQLTIAADNNMDVWEFFNAWMQKIIPHDVTSGMTDTSAYSTNNLVYEVSYKSEYVSTVTITLYNQMGKPIIRSTLRQAFPTNMNGFDINWAARDEYTRFTIFMDYLDWKTERLTTGSTGNPTTIGNPTTSEAIAAGIT